MRRMAFWLLVGTLGMAQERYFASAVGEVSCPRLKETDDDTNNAAGSRSRLTSSNTSSLPTIAKPASAIAGAPKTIEGAAAFPVDGTCTLIPAAERKSVKDFKVMDKGGKGITVADKSGRVVIIGFWASYCQPSSVQLLELVDLQAKGQKFGFEVWPVNYDPERWVKVSLYVQANKAQVGNAELFVPGLAKEGPSVLAGLIPALPAIFLVDKQGRLAAQYAGYQPNTLVNALRALLKEP
jgi:thiol-disulfide isomerase/thioredoxin